MSEVYRAFITAHYEELPVQSATDIIPQKIIEFDYVDDRSISSNATITSSPTVDGDYIADHMYREPKTMSISGKFSLNGYQPTVFDGSDSRLANIETLFEEIQAKGIRCEIATKKANDESSLFVVRDNMYLQSIQWVEKVNSIEFTFNFNEVMTIATDEILYDLDVVDDTLPQLTDAKQSSIFGTLISFEDLFAMIDRIAYETGLTSTDFWDRFEKLSSATAISLVGIAATVGLTYAAISSGLAATIATTVGIPVVGWIVAAGAAIAFIGISLWKIFSDDYESNKFKVEQFIAYDDDKKMKAEIERYVTFKSQIIKQILTIENAIDCYEFVVDDNQETMITIDGDIYDFEFIRNNDTQLYSCKIVNTTSQTIYQQQTISSVTNIADCKPNNCIFRTEQSGYYVYLACPGLAAIDVTKDDGAEVYEEMQRDLTNYQLVVLHFNPEEFTNMLSEIIRNAILK